jgi:hypothetical protein
LKDHEKQLQNNLKSRHAQVQETEKDWWKNNESRA